jgi:hypothetical protein
MKLTDLSAATLQKIDKVRFDRSLEKHEGPYDWNWVFRTAEEENDLAFLTIDNRPILLPIDPEHYANIEILRTIWSADGNSVTIFLKDTTYYSAADGIGYLAVCDRVAGEEFWLAIIYHEWFVIAPDPVFEVNQPG